jgi:hypothetical protein
MPMGSYDMDIPQISYTEDAFTSLFKLINFIESKNTAGAGIRWLNKYEAFLQKKIRNLSIIKKCYNKSFHDLRLHCLNYKDWVIAFSVSKKRCLSRQ